MAELIVVSRNSSWSKADRGCSPSSGSGESLDRRRSGLLLVRQQLPAFLAIPMMLPDLFHPFRDYSVTSSYPLYKSTQYPNQAGSHR